MYIFLSTWSNVYVCINVQYLRVRSVNIHHIINNIYYNSVGIITIYLHYVLCMILGIMWIICCGTPAKAQGSTRKENPLRRLRKRLGQVRSVLSSCTVGSGPWPAAAVEAQHHGQRRTAGESGKLLHS